MKSSKINKILRVFFRSFVLCLIFVVVVVECHQIWLLGYELTDTVIVFTEDAVYFLSSKKKIGFLKQIENHKDKDDGPSVKFLIRDRVR